MASILDWVGRSVKSLMDEYGFPESVAKRISSGELPMDEASRMARAADQSNDELLYHWTNKDFSEFQPSEGGKYGAGVYLSPRKWYGEKYVTSGTPKRMEVLSKGNIAGFEDIAEVEPIARGILQELEPQGSNFGNVYWGLIGDELKKKGFTGLRMDDEVVVFDPSNIRSPNAAFDPEYTGSNILGSRIAPTAGAGLLANETVAADNQSMLLDSYMSQLGADKKPDIYNYSDILPVKRSKVTGDYSYATTGILEEMLRGLLDVGESRKSGVITNPNSILDVLL